MLGGAGVGGQAIPGWVAAVFWLALVSFASHALLISVSVFPAASPCTEHHHPVPERHDYVR